MALRIFGAVVATLLAAYALVRYRKGLLRRGELVVAFVVVAGLFVAAFTPNLFDPLLEPLGFRRGQERRIIGLLVLSNLFTLALVFRGFSREDLLSNEVGDLVDYTALKRLQEENALPPEGCCAVVLPAYNEAENLPSVLGELPARVGGLPAVPIVVADGCTDATEPLARSLGAMVIRRDLRRGSGAAVRLGYQAALLFGARVIVTIDADGQHDPGEMERLVAPLLAGEADMVQGSRTLGSFEIESRIRKHGVAMYSKLLTALSRTPISDPSNGYRAVTAEGLARIDLRQDQFYVSEMILEAARTGLVVAEVPITVRRRASGTTKKPTSFRYAWGFTKAIARTWLRHPPGGGTIAQVPRWVSNSGSMRVDDAGTPQASRPGTIRLDEAGTAGGSKPSVSRSP
jgi:hypothetical protein